MMLESHSEWLQVGTLRVTQGAKQAWQAGSRRAGHKVRWVCQRMALRGFLVHERHRMGAAGTAGRGSLF